MLSSKENGARKNKRTKRLIQLGMTEIPDNFDISAGIALDDDDDDDEDLEAELAALTTSSETKKFNSQISNVTKESKVDPLKIMLDSVIQVEEENADNNDDDDCADLESDADLMNELQVLTGVESSDITPVLKPKTNDETLLTKEDDDYTNNISLLESRIENYKKAETNAIAAQQTSKVRRFSRGLKTLNSLLLRAKAGEIIQNNEIPPEVSVSLSSPLASIETEPLSANENIEKTPELPVYSQDLKDKLLRMRDRQREYKLAALECKRKKDTTTAIEFMKIIKRFDTVIKMCEDGQEVDLSDMPPPPDQYKDFIASLQADVSSQEQPLTTETPDVFAEQVSTQKISEGSDRVLIDALQERFDKYKSVEEKAKKEGNASKTRRFGRILKQYQEAIAAYNAGNLNYEYSELPVPPGFDPLPIVSLTTTTKSEENDNQPSSMNTPDGTVVSKLPSGVNRSLKVHRNVNEQQKKVLLERQREYKIAALQAKKLGDIIQAKELLKICKGFDELITAANNGLPVDMSSLPVKPSEREKLEDSFSIITTDDCEIDGDLAEIRTRVEEQLVKQLMMCKNTRDHLKAMGDVAGMNRFENLGLAVQRDLDVVRYSKRKDISIPKFHYEKRNFNIVRCNTDLTDNELEIIVIRGINYNVSNPKDVDTYVKVEFPLPNDTFFRTKTNLIKDSDNPEYEQHFKVDIIRNNRQFQRIFKRHNVKFEVYSRGKCLTLSCCPFQYCFSGFLRSDILLGVVTVKLQPLESKCDIHNTYDLMEGRRIAGGKLEIKLRVRNPILTKQMEMLEERWLLLDS